MSDTHFLSLGLIVLALDHFCLSRQVILGLRACMCRSHYADWASYRSEGLTPDE